jgi:threonine/homoserine/homoserine lactone efflux protein
MDAALTLEQTMALALFALAGSFTPGPNNAIATATGANLGFRAAIPHIVGVPVGFASMLLAAAGGVAALIVATPLAAGALKALGVAYLLWLAWGLARVADPGAAAASGPFRIPLTFVQSALFQYVNPKAWMLALATAGTWFAGDRALQRGALAALIFGTAALASLAVWAWLGAALRHWLAQGARLRRFNAAMGALLAATALWMAVEPSF